MTNKRVKKQVFLFSLMKMHPGLRFKQIAMTLMKHPNTCIF